MDKKPKGQIITTMSIYDTFLESTVTIAIQCQIYQKSAIYI